MVAAPNPGWRTPAPCQNPGDSTNASPTATTRDPVLRRVRGRPARPAGPAIGYPAARHRHRPGPWRSAVRHGHGEAPCAAAIRESSGLDDLALADHHDAVVGDSVPGAVALGVDADLGVLRDADTLVDDGVADHRVAAHVDALEQYRALDVRPRVHVDVGGDHGVLHQRTGYDRAGGDH